MKPFTLAASHHQHARSLSGQINWLSRPAVKRDYLNIAWQNLWFIGKIVLCLCLFASIRNFMPKYTHGYAQGSARLCLRIRKVMPEDPQGYAQRSARLCPWIRKVMPMDPQGYAKDSARICRGSARLCPRIRKVMPRIRKVMPKYPQYHAKNPQGYVQCELLFSINQQRQIKVQELSGAKVFWDI